MEQLQQLKVWLAGFPGWASATVDTLDAAPGSCGVFPQGIEVVSSREDVLGNRYDRLRQTCLLRRAAPRCGDAAGWVADFSRWLMKNAATAPQLGTRQQLLAEKGRLLSAQGAGAGIYEIRLTILYDSEE